MLGIIRCYDFIGMIKKLIERLKSNQGPKSLKDLYAHYPDYRDLSPDDNDRFGEKFDSLLTELFIDYFSQLLFNRWVKDDDWRKIISPTGRHWRLSGKTSKQTGLPSPC